MHVLVDGAKLHYTTRGAGPTMLVLSAIGTTPYENQLPGALDAHLRLVFVDPRGAGRSTGDAATLTFDRLAADLETIRRELGVQRLAVFGHSALGALAIEYARRCPQVVSHVVTVGTPPHGDMGALAALGAQLFEADAEPERKAVLAENLTRLPPGTPPEAAMLAYTPMRFGDPRFDAAALFAGAEVQPAFFAHLFGTLLAGWRFEAGEPLIMPLWLAQGRHDYASPGRLWDSLLPKLPDATRTVFERSGHQPFVEEPEAFVEALVGWLGRAG